MMKIIKICEQKLFFLTTLNNLLTGRTQMYIDDFVKIYNMYVLYEYYLYPCQLFSFLLSPVIHINSKSCNQNTENRLWSYESNSDLHQSVMRHICTSLYITFKFHFISQFPNPAYFFCFFLIRRCDGIITSNNARWKN